MKWNMKMLDIPTRTESDRIDMIARGFVKNFTGEIHPDRSLQELGLTSLDMVNLMLAIEAEFDLTIPGPKLIPANFRTINTIAALVNELRR